ncbi:hypothetical protein LZ31DRAFT_356197 [Colletotrichum somersetense]|nr:hypothetical protein LZ31DRAFT_356197 [Colletotrichum somersetense]
MYSPSTFFPSSFFFVLVLSSFSAAKYSLGFLQLIPLPHIELSSCWQQLRHWNRRDCDGVYLKFGFPTEWPIVLIQSNVRVNSRRLLIRATSSGDSRHGGPPDKKPNPGSTSPKCFTDNCGVLAPD